MRGGSVVSCHRAPRWGALLLDTETRECAKLALACHRSFETWQRFYSATGDRECHARAAEGRRRPAGESGDKEGHEASLGVTAGDADARACWGRLWNRAGSPPCGPNKPGRDSHGRRYPEPSPLRPSDADQITYTDPQQITLNGPDRSDVRLDWAAPGIDVPDRAKKVTSIGLVL